MSSVSFPSGTPSGSQDLFLVAAPLIAFNGGEDFVLQLGAPLRVRVFDDPPAQRDRDFEGFLRREDWDQVSDFGQLVQALRVGSNASAVSLRVGAFEDYTLGNGQLISRYSNRTNPDYHPASARAVLAVGPTRTELFASDVLGGRILAAEMSVDIGRSAQRSDLEERYYGALSVLHDFGRAGGVAPPLTLGWLEGTAVLVRQARVRLDAYAGLGARAGSGLGATLGLTGEGEPAGMRLGGRLEARKLNAGFRQGMVAHDYELARFSAIGLGRTSIAEEQLPDTASFRAEVSVAAGGEEIESELPSAFSFTASGEYFLFGRTLLDAAFSARVLEGKGAMGARLAVSGLGQAARTLVSLEGQYRFAPSFYAVASGGTVFFAQPGGGLSRGFHVGGGIGADFER